MTDLTACREAFEKWAESEGFSIVVGEYNAFFYEEAATRFSWKAWQAAWDTRANDKGGEAVALYQVRRLGGTNWLDVSARQYDNLCGASGVEWRITYAHPPRATAVEDARDAARYRWLKTHAVTGSIGFRDWWINGDEPESEWDASIDAALSDQRREVVTGIDYARPEDFKYNPECWCQICTTVKTGSQLLGMQHSLYPHMPPKETGND